MAAKSALSLDRESEQEREGERERLDWRDRAP